MAAPADDYQRAHTALVTASRGCLEKEDEYGDEFTEIPNIVVFVDLSTATPLIHCMSWYDLRAVLIAPNTPANDRVRFWRSEPIPSNYVYHVRDRWYDPALEPLTRYYNTFLYTGSYDAEIGTYFAASALHGATERLHRVRPVHRADVLAYVREEITTDELRERLWATAGRAADGQVADGALAPTTFHPQPLDTILPEALLTERQLAIARLADNQPFGPGEQWRRGDAETFTIFTGEPLPSDDAPIPAPVAAPVEPVRGAWIDESLMGANGNNWMQSLLSRVFGRRPAEQSGPVAVGDVVVEREVAPPSPPRPRRLFHQDGDEEEREVAPPAFPPLPASAPALESETVYYVRLPASRDVFRVVLESDGQVRQIIRGGVPWTGSLFMEELVIWWLGAETPVTVRVRPVDGRVEVRARESDDMPADALPEVVLTHWQQYFQRELAQRPAVALVRTGGTHVLSLWEVEVWQYADGYQFLVGDQHAPAPLLYRGAFDLTTPDEQVHARLLSPTDAPTPERAVFRYDDARCGYRAAELPADVAGHVTALLTSQAHYYQTPLELPFLVQEDVRYVWAAGALYSLQDGNEYVPTVGVAGASLMLRGRQWTYDVAADRLLNDAGQLVTEPPAPLRPLFALLVEPVLATVDYGGPALTVRDAGKLYYTETPRRPTAVARSLWPPILLTRVFHLATPGQPRTRITLPSVLPERWEDLRAALLADMPRSLHSLMERQFDEYHAAAAPGNDTYSGFNIEDADADGDMLAVNYSADELVFWDVADSILVTPPDLGRPTILLVHVDDTVVRVFRDVYGRNIPVVEGDQAAMTPDARADFERLWPLLDSTMAAYHPRPCGNLSPGALIYGDLHIYRWNGTYVAIDQRTGEQVELPVLPANTDDVIGRPADIAAYRQAQL